MDLITLIGDADENFYQLGLKDKANGKIVHTAVKNMLRTPWNKVNIVVEEVAKVVIKNSLLKKTEHYRHLHAYSEGMGISVEQAAYTMLIPELVSSMSKWAPGLIKGNLGCSSFITRNSEGEVIHGRILDFPLQGSYDLYERAVLYDLKGIPKMLGFGSAGIPYPSITLMTESGITLALHQKFTNVFNTNGQSIFEYIFDLIKNCNDKESAVEFIKSHPTLTTWCLYMTFKNGDVIAADIMGEKSYIHHPEIPENGILYFCNHLEDKSLLQRDFLPLGFDQYNLMREMSAAEKIHNYLDKKKKTPDQVELLQLMTTPIHQKETQDFKSFKQDNITPSSLTAVVMNPTAQKAVYNEGPAPKVFRDTIVEITHAFDRLQKNPVKIKKNQIVSDDYYQGLHTIMEAQKALDVQDSVNAYHNLQMAIDHLSGHLEKKVVQFYFLVAQYMYESHTKVLAQLLQDFRVFEDQMPEYLNDHCLLFITRLEKILKMEGAPFEEDRIKTPRLRDIYRLEQKIPRALFHITTKKSIIPRMDILDIIYLYTF
jgi:hypothetical protein